MKTEKYDITPLRLKKRLSEKERATLSNYAVFSSDAVRRFPDKKLEKDYRQAFSVDADRILNSLSYTRYIDKTQVFSLIRNDHITHRVLHVQLVSKIARTIGRALDLNEDLIEAISIGHDVGHPPFGHDGETFLSEICKSYGIGEFHHNIQSVHFLNTVERKGHGWNLSLQTLDGILCHNGEVHDLSITPKRGKSFSDLYREMSDAVTGKSPCFIPMTLEGCTVRMADTISYIGRDIDDAIRIGMLKRSDLPEEYVKILGKSNGTMVYNLVTSIIENSFGTDSISYSNEISDALRSLKQFNLKHIYLNPAGKEHLRNISDLFKILFEKYMIDLENQNDSSVIVTKFLCDMSDEYRKSMSNAEIVRDFIAGMTDMYFYEQCPDDRKPHILTR